MSFRRSHLTAIRLSLGVALMVLTYLMLVPIDHSIIEKTNDKIAHILAFYLLALLVDFSFPDRVFNRSKVLPLLVYALLMETIQYFVSYRIFSVF